MNPSPASTPSRSAIIRALVGHLTERGIGVLITDHNVRETLELIDRAYIIYDGSVLTEGSPDGNYRQRGMYAGSISATNFRSRAR